MESNIEYDGYYFRLEIINDLMSKLDRSQFCKAVDWYNWCFAFNLNSCAQMQKNRNVHRNWIHTS